jgi:hypothetical protein
MAVNIGGFIVTVPYIHTLYTGLVQPLSYSPSSPTLLLKMTSTNLNFPYSYICKKDFNHIRLLLFLSFTSFLFFINFLAALGFDLRTSYLLHRCSYSLNLPPFYVGYFQELFAWSWLQTVILLISASWVARIRGVSHWCPASSYFEC